jgi:hypothetical protein
LLAAAVLVMAVNHRHLPVVMVELAVVDMEVDIIQVAPKRD